MRCGRYALPSGTAALAAAASRGPILLVDAELSRSEALVAGSLALARFPSERFVLISREEMREAMRVVDDALEREVPGA